MTPEGSTSDDSKQPIAARDIGSASSVPGAPSSRQRRFLTASSRLARIMSLWFDDKSYWKIVSSGRFLKLSQATHRASENLQSAARRGWHVPEEGSKDQTASKGGGPDGAGPDNKAV